MGDNCIFEGSAEVEIELCEEFESDYWLSPEFEGRFTEAAHLNLGTKQWRLWIGHELDVTDGNKKLKLCLEIFKGSWNNFWSIDAVFSICLLSAKKGVENIVKNDTVCFKFENKSYVSSPIGSKDYIMNEENGFLVDEKFRVRVEMKIKRATGVKDLELNNYSFPSDLSDIVFVVEGRNIHANKMYLSMNSSYFKTIFSAGFKECGIEEIELKDVKHDEFVDLLNIIYPGHARIDKTNVESLLKLADRFDCPQVFHVCEEFLMKTEDFTKSRKVEMASRYRLPELYDSCLKSFEITDVLEMRYCGIFDNLDSRSKAYVFHILMNFYEELF